MTSRRRSRSPLLLSLFVATLAVLLTGCDTEPEGPPLAVEPEATDPTPGLPAPGEAAPACGPEERPTLQGGEHLIGDAEPPVPYSSSPPTSGWHASGHVDIRIYQEPLSEPRQVSVIEGGGVVVAYSAMPEGERTELERFVEEHYAGRVAVTPYEPLEAGEIVFTAWGVLQRCERLDLDALATFVETHADADPQTGH